MHTGNTQFSLITDIKLHTRGLSRNMMHLKAEPDDTVSGGVSGGLSPLAPQYVLMLIASFTAIAWYNVIELIFLIFHRFRRRRGLYFYSLLISCFGITLHALGFLAKHFQIWKNDLLSVGIICVGWYCMVTGQSLVLYSMLEVVSGWGTGKRWGRFVGEGRWVLLMIVVNAIFWHGSTTVLLFGANSSNPERFLHAYSIMEKMQVTAFAIQETIISSLYIYYTYRLLHPGSLFPQTKARKVMRQLIIVNVIVIAMTLTLLGTEFTNHYEIQTTYKSALYSIKLKLEFVVLYQLVELTKGKICGSSGAGTGGDTENLRLRGEMTGEDMSLESGAREMQEGVGGRDGLSSHPRDWVGGAHGMEPPSRTYFVSARTNSHATRMRTWRADSEVGVIKTVDVKVTSVERKTNTSKPERRKSDLSEAETLGDGIDVIDIFEGLGVAEEMMDCEKGKQSTDRFSSPALTLESELEETDCGKGKGPQVRVSSQSLESELELVTGGQFLDDVLTPLGPRPIKDSNKKMRNFYGIG